jgi:hypothetical protein
VIVIIPLGTIVQDKLSKNYGTVEYSSFGYSIHSWLYDEEYGEVLGKSLALSEEEVMNQFNIIDKVPDGHVLNVHGGLKKVN